MARSSAPPGWPSASHTTTVTTAAPRAYQNSQPAALSASRWVVEEDACASATSLRMPAKVVSSPTAVTLTRTPESVAMVPATTRSPEPRWTGTDSPVTIDSSKAAVPSTMTPSAGTEAPGRTTTTSSRRRPAGATVTI